MNKERSIRGLMRRARFGFENDLSRLMQRGEGISRAELARRYGASAPFISGLLNGVGKNYQLETMAKIAFSLGAVLEIRMADEDSEFVRVVDKEAAALVDARHTENSEIVGTQLVASNVVSLLEVRERRKLASLSVSTGSTSVSPNHPIAAGEV